MRRDVAGGDIARRDVARRNVAGDGRRHVIWEESGIVKIT
jgi:hypothetical protein